MAAFSAKWALAALLIPLVAGCGPQSSASPEQTVLQVTTREDGHSEALLAGPGARAVQDRLRHGEDAEQLSPYFRFEMGSGPPLLAHLENRGTEVALVPQAPLNRGTEYHVVFLGAELQSGLTNSHNDTRVPGNLGQPSNARIAEVFPSGDPLPANVFRFYVTFSEPMAEGKVFQFVRLLNEAGKPIPQAFHEIELWADDHRRLTLWISPGRTKEALGISEKMGAVLQPGRHYTLEIGHGLPDRSGHPLRADYRLSFRAGEPDHRQPDVKEWRIAPGRAGTREALVVRFPEQLDRPLLDQLLSVTHPDGAPVKGSGAAAPDGLKWSFTPDGPWPASELTLRAGGDLDDLAGNSLYRLFETPVEAGKTPVVEAPTFTRAFRPLSAP